jgi:hypothetical protein
MYLTTAGVTRVIREPLVWFFAAGATLFALAPRESREHDELHVSRASLTSLELAEARRRHVRALPPNVAATVRQQAIDDELLYREGLRLGVDKNDNVIRQRVIEKMLFLAEDLGGAARPVDDAELEQYLEEHAAQFRRAAQVSFIHVFSAADAESLARLRPSLPAGIDSDAAVPPNAGEAFPVGRRVIDTPLAALARSWGGEFAAQLAQLPIGEWSAPVRSQYGFHLVKVLARSDAAMPSLAEVHDAVRAAYLQERKARGTADFLRSVHERHPVVIDDSPDALPVGGSVRAPVAD